MSTPASFNFDQYTGSQPFTLNTCMTTSFGPAWANIVTQASSNFLPCTNTTTPIALCYYSGPAGVAPCVLADDLATATCTCYVIPATNQYSVDINAISNLNTYVDTYTACGSDGSACSGNNNSATELCNDIQSNTLVPGAGLISAFSTYLSVNFKSQFAGAPTQCTTTPAPLYAGCMTAPCTLTGTKDQDPPNGTGLALATCTCPTYSGPYQVGLPNQGENCSLGDNSPGAYVWSASYTPPQTPTQLVAAIKTDLDLLVSFGELTTGEAHSLGAKADAASMNFQNHDNPAGKNILHAMLNDVSALLKSKRISSHTASVLSGAISNAIASL